MIDDDYNETNKAPALSAEEQKAATMDSTFDGAWASRRLEAASRRLRAAMESAGYAEATAERVPWSGSYRDQAERARRDLATAKAVLAATVDDVEDSEWTSFWAAAGRRKVAQVEHLSRVGGLVVAGKAALSSVGGWFSKWQ